MRRTITIISLLALTACHVSEAPETLPPLQLAPPSTSSTTVAPTTTSTTTTTTVAPTTTVDPVVVAYQERVNEMTANYPKCAEWLPLFLEAGAPLEDWPTWSKVVWTESRCQPQAINPSGNCLGLTQIFYTVHKEWLTQMGWDRDDLLDPVVNITFAVMLQSSSGWSPWAYLNLP